ncbi:MAG TPA: MazG family protein [Acidimicrobiales bacterium]|nr:MazG family protein [Acidimicrobiales bacterium]
MSWSPAAGDGRGRIVVVGLGPGDPALLTAAAAAAIEACPVRFLRTARHPSAAVVTGAATFDELYEQAATFEEVYTAIVDRLVAAAVASAPAPVCYAVPGSPLVAERTVELLRADRRVEVEVVAALSFLDLAWGRLGVDPVASGVRLVDGHRFAAEAAGSAGPLLVAQCDSSFVLSEVKLAISEAAPPDEVVVLQRLGLPDESVRAVAWPDLDRVVDADHLTCVWVPTMAAPVAGEVARFAELVRVLRERCPWDRRQTHASLTRYLLEEAYEVVDAIDELERDGDPAHLEEELGDLLFQVVFHATLAAEEGAFTLADVATGIHDKLVRRHPHVFGGPDTGKGWEEIKAAEQGRTSAMEGLPEVLPALLLAAKVLGRAAPAAGPRWPTEEEAVALVRRRVDAVVGAADDPAAAVGDLLLAVVAVARASEVDAEAALRGATGRFRRRFDAADAARARAAGAPVADRRAATALLAGDDV